MIQKIDLCYSQTVLAALALPTELAAQEHLRYKLIDIGTFGGSMSYVNVECNSVPRGTTIGGSAKPVLAPALKSRRGYVR